MVSGGATNNTITGLSPAGNNCTVRVTAMFASSGISESNEVNTNTISEGMYSAVDTHSLLSLSSSYWCSCNAQYHISGEQVTHFSVEDSTLP